ncbi:hypothetical protein [Neobacillus sp. SAB-20_R2A]
MMNGTYGAFNNTIGGLCGGGVFGVHFSTLLLSGLTIFVLYLIFKK